MSNSTIVGIDNLLSKQVSTQTTTTTKTLGKDDFMKLLLAQLKNQDPLKPLDGTDFAAQLAQFSSLEQLSNMNAELKNLSLNQASTNYTQAINMIGKEVVANSGNALAVNSPSTELSYKLAKDAQTVTITILDKDGKVVKSWDETNQKSGMNKVTWDSAAVEKGDYSFLVKAKDSKGEPVSVDTMTSGVVTAVQFRNNGILVTVNGKDVPLSNIVEVRQKELPLSEIPEAKSSNIISSIASEAIKQFKL